MTNSQTLRPRTISHLLFAALLVTSMHVQAQTGPVGWWKLDEGTGTATADSSDSGNNGTLVNSPAWVTGRVGPFALSFTGTTPYVSVTNSGNLNNLYQSGMTVTAWIKPVNAGGGGRGRIIDFDNNAGGWFFCMYTSSTIQFLSDEFDTTAAYRVSSSAITLNSWQHVAATWDGSAFGGNIHLYVNGAAADSSTIVNGVGAQSGESGIPFTIGNRTVDSARGFNGSIDDVRVYNRILSAAEIQELAATTTPTAPASLAATPASSAQINLTWTASTDSIAVTGYRVERCSPAGCTNFAQIAIPSGTSYSDTGLTASTSYAYRVRATDSVGNVSPYSNMSTATTPSGGGDTTPPTAPSALTASAASANQINLSWSASTDAVGVTGYLVERCQGGGCTTFAQINTAGTNSYSDLGLSPSSAYTYRVRATDAAGNLSPYSNTAGATTSAGSSDTQAPSVPGNLAVLASSSTEIDLTWSPSSDNVEVTGYMIERCQGGGCSTFTQIGSPAAPPFYDAGRNPATSYSYRVRATDAAGNLSSYSAVLTYVTPISSPDCN